MTVTAPAPAHAAEGHLRADGTGRRIFAALVAAGLLFRVLVARTTWLRPDADEAVGMVMALRASEGHLSLLFWGGDYGGAEVTWLEGGLVAVFGFHFWIFWLVDTAISAVIAVLVWRVATRLLPPVAAAVAGGVSLAFPPLWVYWSGREYVFWLPAVAFALGACLLAQRWIEGRGRVTATACELSAGLAVWSYPLVLPLFVPALLAAAWCRRRYGWQLAAMVGGGAAGIMPWAAFFLIHGSAAFQQQAVGGSAAERLRHMLTQVLSTAIVGGQTPTDLSGLIPVPRPHILAFTGLAVYGVATLCGVAFAIMRRTSLALCAASVVLWPVALFYGHVPVGIVAFRYGLIPLPALVVLACALLSFARASLALVGVAALAAVTTIWPGTGHLRAVPTCSATLRVTGQYLEAEHRTVAFGSYWLASALEVCSQPQLVVGAVAPVRDHEAQALASSAPATTYVVFPGMLLDQEIFRYNHVHRSGGRRVQVPGGYAVWLFDGRVLPAQMQLNSAL